MKKLAIPMTVLTYVIAIYVSVWLMFIKPIYDACILFDNGKLTALTIFIVIVKCLLAKFVFGLIVSVGTTLIFLQDGK